MAMKMICILGSLRLCRSERGYIVDEEERRKIEENAKGGAWCSGIVWGLS
jgi:hypothetical protein